MAVTATITASHANAQKLSEAETLLGSADDHLRTPFSPSPTHMNSRSLVRPFENFKAHLPEHEVRKVTVPEPTKAQAQHQFPERCTEVEPRAHEKAEECCSMSSYVFISGGATLQRASNLGLKHNHHEPGEQACDAVSKAHTVSGPLQLGTCVCSAAYRKGLDQRETLQNCLCEFPCFRRIWGTCIGNVEVWPGKPFDHQSEHGGRRPHARLVKTLFHLDVRILYMLNIGMHGSSGAISFQPILQKFLSSRCTRVTSFHPARPPGP